LAAFNGIGGFTPDGREYIITVHRRPPTPAPWINVLANPDFGTIVSESGEPIRGATTLRSFRLTPGTTTGSRDVSGEAFYIRDEESGAFWSPTPLPAPGPPVHDAARVWLQRL
jgi:cyclic beta-1,2-glucan synthetase